MRLIDADLILNDNKQFYYYLTDEWVVRVRDIEQSETVDAVPVKRGEWVKTGQSFVNPNRFRNYCCSVCGYDIKKTKYNYCPNCGAKMDL